MPKYMLSIYQPDGDPPSPELLEPVMRKMNALIDEAKAARVWVFNGGLANVNAASVVRFEGGEQLTTDGPYIEGKEHIGGVMIVDVPDLDAALRWASRMAQNLTLPGAKRGLPVEVRPFGHL